MSQITQLKFENTELRNKIDNLKYKVIRVESAGPSSSHSEFVSQVLQETFERDKCSLNVLAYGLPEFLLSSATQRISDDNSSFVNILTPFGITLPTNWKSIRLGKLKPDFSGSLKITFNHEKEASNLLIVI